MLIHLTHNISPLIKLSFNIPKSTRCINALSTRLSKQETNDKELQEQITKEKRAYGASFNQISNHCEVFEQVEFGF
jgi:hypothetical protein